MSAAPTPSSPPPKQQLKFFQSVGEGRVVYRGRDWHPVADPYHFLMRAPWWQVLLLCAVGYLCANVAFASLYWLERDGIENARQGSFSDAFFFSVQTMATIGYGKLVPRSLFANVLVTVEALFGLLLMAMATGLMFAKFSRPSAKVRFSSVAIIHPRNGVPTLAFRMANERGNQVVEAQLHVVLLRDERTQEGERMRRQYDLALVRSQTAVFYLTWTAMHELLPSSPLYGCTLESLQEQRAEIIVSLLGLDETVGQTIHARYSYLPSELRWNERFVDVISELPDGRRQVDLEVLDKTTSSAA